MRPSSLVPFVRSAHLSFVLLAAVAPGFAPAGAAARSGAAPAAFVTSVAGTGDLGSWPDAGLAVGLDAGDAICAARAAGAGLPDPGQFRAWLSTETVDAFCHVQGWSGERVTNCGLPGPPENAGPWWRTDGHPFLPRLLSALGPAGAVRTAPDVDEFGTAIPDADNVAVWTGTTDDGVALAGSVCQGWTSGSTSSGVRGHLRVATAGFTEYFLNGACGNQARLLCLQGAAGAAFPGPAAGPLAFVTTVSGSGDLSSWPGAAGYAGAAAGDRVCRAAATVAGFAAAQSFRALLSDAARPVRDRLVGDGVWRRVDGTLVAESKSDLFDGRLVGPVHQTEAGDYLGGERVFSGSTYFGTRATDRCADWTSTGGAAAAGIAHFGSRSWLSATPVDCSDAARLYCLTDPALILESGFEGGDASEWSLALPRQGVTAESPAVAESECLIEP